MSDQDGKPAGPSPPMAELVTLIITTSPTPSAPSTELVSHVLNSFKLHCSELLSCRVIVVLDGYDSIKPEMRLKKGQITAEGAEACDLYKKNIKDLILKEHYPERTSHVILQGTGQAEYGLPGPAKQQQPRYVTFTTLQTDDKGVTFIEPAGRLGFGLAVRTALRMTETPYVWIQQHDWPLVRSVPLGPLLEIMQASDHNDEPVRYLCLPSVRMLCYAVSDHVTRFPVLRELTAKLKRDFFPPSQPERGFPLTPLFFWHDKPHIASTAHYLARVFPTPLAMGRGEFIEDTIGHRARTQMKEGIFSKWACWLYYPKDGKEACVRHLKGRTWLGTEGELAMKMLRMEMNGMDVTGKLGEPPSE